MSLRLTDETEAFGPLDSGDLTLESPIRDALWTTGGRLRYRNELLRGDAYPDQEDHSQQSEKEVKILFLFSMRSPAVRRRSRRWTFESLVLEPVDKGMYRRIGQAAIEAHCGFGEDFSVDLSARQTVTIV